MAYQRNFKGIQNFLGDAGFYRKLIKYFSKICRLLTNLLQKEFFFCFYDDFNEVFEILKMALMSTTIVQPSDWNLPFEIMCDASDYAIGVKNTPYWQ